MSTTPAVKYKPVSDDGFEDVKTDDDHEEYPLDQRKWNSCRGTSKSRRALQILASLLILAIYTWAVLYYAREVIYKPFCPRLTTPDTVHVWDKVEFNPQPVNPVTPGHDHPLLGNPSPEVDANWSALLSGKPFVSVDVAPRHRFTNQSQRLPTESRNPRYTDLAWRQMRYLSTMEKAANTKHPIYGNFLDEHGKFSWVDQEGGVDYKEFFKTPEYQEWAKEQGLASGEAAAEEYLRSFYVKQ
ncbi:uncharacterized protein CLUP02_05949 [Colletotrichum lupini]|uniref:Uncharacterized protein n=1 Tax=Colletotrichum lupini TaxID=145971 RepID=A0A9Q8WEN9_9PEZI|nr:uncharacterized protein CLUP02_05949 [Colletotrichum lupini]UQC80466.1 hypothetical protein CLUP02_05949 [Colletotrichum lupini]